MVQLLPGTSSANAIALLQTASREGSNLIGRGLSGVDGLNAYRDWSTTEARLLSTVLTATSLERLILTGHYWMLQQIAPVTYGPSLTNAVQLGLTDAVRRLNEAIRSLERRSDIWSSWGQQGSIAGELNAIILDTNVLLRHAHEFGELKWNESLNVFPRKPIALGIPITVVEELDRLKSSNASMYFRDAKHSTRTIARRALKTLDNLFQTRSHTVQLGQQGSDEDGVLGDLRVILMMDDLDHVRLPEVDAEIIDQARELSAYVATVAIASYDNALLFRARSEGLVAFKPEDDLLEEQAR